MERKVFNGVEVTSDENDGSKLFQKICGADSGDDIVTILGCLEGPYAFSFYHATSQSLYFGRDPLGRRSLLVHWPTVHQPCFVLSSVSDGVDDFLFEEVDTKSIFCIRFADIATDERAFLSLKDRVRSVSRIPFPSASGLPYASLLHYPETSPNSTMQAVPGRVNQDVPEANLPQIHDLDTIPSYLQAPVDRLISKLDESVRLQVQNIPQRSPGKARLAILFSGGIDSTALCYFADRHLPKDEAIDLLNVAFENPRKVRLQFEGDPNALPKHLKRERKKQMSNSISTQSHTSYMVPDRISGLEELEELRLVCPGRTWNFVEIDVPYEETQEAKAVVQSTMFPSRTVMDFSLALALWFASRGSGVTRSSLGSNPQPYNSDALVLLNGLGSDELLGGYGRHRSAFNSGGWPAVVEELQLEIDRIPTRNLGRDDRIISSHGKETRHPFLSLDVVSFLADLPVHHKMDPRLAIGLGDKMLLRLAMRKVGLRLVSSRKKRAMQFGSHSARMEGERRGDIPLE
ncbi:hypothetical protein AGABI1DRAFT_124024 [Agaricus bisporus var. burnettii JB137-S8]|uniref:Asparagine synthetase domain-containing protein n=1 Tax=Agaricus bisporus var. burnettii (strain JB137-S8 / ATCC MYA-4627 / FGSC 10392) TaxID=597362 RepID=K5X743_AGABU|nr:uncharacterized protein AGABI1DRAFT_124024 [Agaricus bisporus var. burnettii JB137-S8]EKM83696.1 hypothetical protein AGABI1DRAFT_124024 [Agaricus bisporus var. burnettii JB137-S8]